MDYMKVPITDNFNWDDIDVGNHALDHSQKFFAKKHIKHERLDESEEGMDLLKEIDAITLDDTFKSMHDKENANVISTPKSCKKSPLKEIQTPIINEGNKPEVIKPKINNGCAVIKVEEVSPIKDEKTNIVNTVNFSDSLIARNRARINPGGKKKSSPPKSPMLDAEPPASNVVVLSESLIVRNRARINPGVKKENCTTKATAAAISDGNDNQPGTDAKPKPAPTLVPTPPAPHAYQCNELYRRRKEELLRKRLEEERKMREFHSRPVPNFSAHHRSLQQKRVVHAVTVPVTPVVLKKSRETEEKRRQRLEELKQVCPPKIEPRPPTVVHEEPFVPKKSQTVSVQCPFNLRSERRLQERKQYDAAIQRSMEEKHKQEEVERKKREELRIKELRKLTSFKARPNPFKH